MVIEKQSRLEGEEVILLPNVEKINGEYIYKSDMNILTNWYFWSNEVKQHFTVSDNKIRSILLQVSRSSRGSIIPYKRNHCYIYHDSQIKVLEFSKTLKDVIDNYNKGLVESAFKKGENKIRLIWKPPFDKSLRIVAKPVTGGFSDYKKSEIVDADPLFLGNSKNDILEFLSNKDLKLEDIPKNVEFSKNEIAYDYVINLPELIELKREMRNDKIDKIIL